MKRKPGKKRLSLFNLMVMLIIMAAVVVFYVNNIIAVNGLASENSIIREQINKNTTLNNGLQTEIERLSNFDNIKSVAVDKLKLDFSKNRPKKIDIPESEVKDLSE